MNIIDKLLDYKLTKLYDKVKGLKRENNSIMKMAKVYHECGDYYLRDLISMRELKNRIKIDKIAYRVKRIRIIRHYK